MNKHESKYFNTASLMDDALISLLDKKEYELITIKDVCQKAGVNRSTFYLHYENMGDLLKECVDSTTSSFFSKFEKSEINLDSVDLNDLIFINQEYLAPYLQFVKDNVKLFKVVHRYPHLFGANDRYAFLFDNVFNPVLKRFGFGESDNRYLMEYYLNGVTALVLRWASEGCKEEIDKMIQLIMLCIRPKIGDNNGADR